MFTLNLNANSREVLMEVHNEYTRSTGKYGNFHSAHEGFAILLEEVDELWDEIKKRPSRTDNVAIREEARHVAAMAFKIMLFVSKTETDILLICRKCKASFTCKKDSALELHNLCHECEMERHKKKRNKI